MMGEWDCSSRCIQRLFPDMFNSRVFTVYTTSGPVFGTRSGLLILYKVTGFAGVLLGVLSATSKTFRVSGIAVTSRASRTSEASYSHILVLVTLPPPSESSLIPPGPKTHLLNQRNINRPIPTQINLFICLR